MYGSVPQSDGHARVWVKDASAHLKGACIFLMYDCPKRLSFIAAMGLKFGPHFYIVLINTLRYVFISLCPITTYLSLSLGYSHCFVNDLSPKRQSLIVVCI